MVVPASLLRLDSTVPGHTADRLEAPLMTAISVRAERTERGTVMRIMLVRGTFEPLRNTDLGPRRTSRGRGPAGRGSVVDEQRRLDPRRRG